MHRGVMRPCSKGCATGCCDDEAKRTYRGLDRGRHGFPKKGTHSVGVVRQYCGQVGKQEIVGSSEFVISHRTGQSPDCVAPVPARDLGSGSEASQETGIPREVTFATKRRSRFSDSEGGRGRSHNGSRVGRCRLWQRWPVSRRAHRTGFGIVSVFRNPRPSGTWRSSLPRRGGKEGPPANAATPGQNTINPFP